MNNQIPVPSQQLERPYFNSRFYFGLRYLFFILLRIFFKIYHRLELIHASSLRNIENQPIMIVANHCSHLDVLFFLSMVPVRLRENIFVLSKKENFNVWPIQWITGLVKAYPIDRDGNFITGIHQSFSQIEKGRILFVHPEGTRSATGKLGSIKNGSALVAVEKNLNLLPVKIIGSFEALPKGSLFLKPLKIKVEVGKLIEIEPFVTNIQKVSTAKAKIEIYSQVSNLIRDALS